MNRTRIVFFVVLAVALVIVGVSVLLTSTGGQPKPVLPTPAGPGVGARGHRAAGRAVGPRGCQGFQRRAAPSGGQPHQRVHRPHGWPGGDGPLGPRRDEPHSHRLDPGEPLPGGAGQRRLQGAPGPRRLSDRRRISGPPDRHLACSPGASTPAARRCCRPSTGEIDWQAIHDAAIAKGGWRELGGQPEWGYFKLVVPNPRKNVGGLLAMVAAAGVLQANQRVQRPRSPTRRSRPG